MQTFALISYTEQQTLGHLYRKITEMEMIWCIYIIISFSKAFAIDYQTLGNMQCDFLYMIFVICYCYMRCHVSFLSYSKMLMSRSETSHYSSLAAVSENSRRCCNTGSDISQRVRWPCWPGLMSFYFNVTRKTISSYLTWKNILSDFVFFTV